MTQTIRLIAMAAASAVAAACTIPFASAENAGVPATDAPIRCALEVTQSGGAVTIEGRVEAIEPVTGLYTLDLVQTGGGNSSTVSQGGPIHLAAGESTRLGETRLSGRAAEIDGTLTLQVNGRTLVCPVTGRT